MTRAFLRTRDAGQIRGRRNSDAGVKVEDRFLATRARSPISSRLVWDGRWYRKGDNDFLASEVCERQCVDADDKGRPSQARLPVDPALHRTPLRRETARPDGYPTTIG